MKHTRHTTCDLLPVSFPDEKLLDALPGLSVLGWKTEKVGVELVVEERDPEFQPVRRGGAVCPQHIVHVQVVHQSSALLVRIICTRSLRAKRLQNTSAPTFVDQRPLTISTHEFWTKPCLKVENFSPFFNPFFFFYFFFVVFLFILLSFFFVRAQLKLDTPSAQHLPPKGVDNMNIPLPKGKIYGNFRFVVRNETVFRTSFGQMSESGAEPEDIFLFHHFFGGGGGETKTGQTLWKYM